MIATDDGSDGRVLDQRTARSPIFGRDVCADFEAEPIEFNGENNHVHLLVTKALLGPGRPCQRRPSPPA
ncbi:hypothetical protein [Actinoplanes philippinensis]|uniref:hypothetical protein n=1 Tax=Actinoplanes philippinensis TaxID=35752 RepID=UPI0033F76547